VRGNRLPLALNTCHYIALEKLAGELEISFVAAAELMLNFGLYSAGRLSDEDFKPLDARYRRPLKKVVEENKANRENSHLSKLELEKRKGDQALEEARKIKVAKDVDSQNRYFKEVLAQWDIHDLNWQIKQIASAKNYPDLECAKLIIAKDCDTISQKEGGEK